MSKIGQECTQFYVQHLHVLRYIKRSDKYRSFSSLLLYVQQMSEFDVSKEKIGIMPNSLISLDNYSLLQREFDSYKYSKLASIIRLRSAGLPTLPGFVVKDLKPEILDYLSTWNLSIGAKRLSLRFDSPNPEDNIKLQGSNPSLEELSNMAHFFKPPVIGIILAENDRFNQDHSVLTYFSSDCIVCEVVGPGFDAADLTKGNVSPHESLEIFRKNTDECHSDLNPFDIINHDIIKPESYQLSRRIRSGVIFSILEKGLGKAVSSKDLTPVQIIRVDDFLKERGATVPDTYQPLGYDRLHKLYTYLGQLDTFREYYKEYFQLNVEGKVLSASFLKKYGLVFWDLYGAERYNKR